MNEEEERIKHLNHLHKADKHDDVNWRNSKEGIKWRKENEK